MTIVDQYIFDHKDRMTNGEIAVKLGVPEEYVRVRKFSPWKPLPAILITPEEEIYALVQFILQREKGCLVDIAKQRIKDISKSLNR